MRNLHKLNTNPSVLLRRHYNEQNHRQVMCDSFTAIKLSQEEECSYMPSPCVPEFTQKRIKQQIIHINFTVGLFVRLLCAAPVPQRCLTGKHTIPYLLTTLLYAYIKQQLSCSSINIVYLKYGRMKSGGTPLIVDVAATCAHGDCCPDPLFRWIFSRLK